MAYHITVGEVHYDEIIFVFVDSSHQFIFYFVSAHFRFQVVSSYFRRRNEDTVFLVKRSFTSTVEEERHVSILFRFSDMKLAHTLSRKILTQSVSHIFFVEQDMYTFERSVIRSHTVILQSRNGVHACFRHILLSQHNGQLFGTVVTIVEEDYHVTFFDCSVDIGIYNRLDKFVRHTFIVRFLHCLNHIGCLLSFTVHQQIVCFFYTFPTFVTIHCVITTDDGSDLPC